MSKQLGTRCPECGTDTAPQVILAISPHAETQWIAVCPRCGHQAFAELAVHALEDFYGPQEEQYPSPREMTPCVPSPFSATAPGGLGVEPGSVTVEDDIEEARRRG